MDNQQGQDGLRTEMGRFTGEKGQNGRNFKKIKKKAVRQPYV